MGFLDDIGSAIFGGGVAERKEAALDPDTKRLMEQTRQRAMRSDEERAAERVAGADRSQMLKPLAQRMARISGTAGTGVSADIAKKYQGRAESAYKRLERESELQAPVRGAEEQAEAFADSAHRLQMAMNSITRARQVELARQRQRNNIIGSAIGMFKEGLAMSMGLPGGGGGGMQGMGAMANKMMPGG